MNIQRFLRATALVGVLSAVPAVAHAADAPAAAPAAPAAAPQTDPNCDPAKDPNCKPAEAKDIVITGSRIARPTLESSVPVTTVTASDLLSTATLNVGDALNNLPALRSTFSQANSTRFIGTSGLNLLDLRGLGTARTLVLVNGRRHITASPGDYLIDTNTIPDDLLERVDVVTGGNSAIYGSDAVAGVVNFILKRDFDGIRISGQGSITSRGDRGSYFGALTAGKNFADGRGNIAVALEYSRANALYAIDRDELTGAYSGRNQFNLSENTAGETAGGNGVPDNQFFRGVRNGTIADGGLVTAVCNAAFLADLTRCRASSTNTTFFGQRYVFTPGGNLTLSNPSLDFRDITGGASSNTVGGLGSTLQNTGQLDPKLERYSANLLAHFDFSPAFRPFIEAKYVRIYANQEGQPSFWQGSIPGFFGGGVNLTCANPFLTAQAQATLINIGVCANANSAFAISRFNVDFGGRGELHKRETYRFVGGVAGTFNDDWNYEVAVNYGELRTNLTSLNNLKLFDLNGNDDGFLLAINAVNAPVGFTGTNFAIGANGQKVVCAVNAVTNTRPDCVPLNPFGVGSPSAAALAFVNTTATRVEKATEFDVTVNLTGDLSQLFTLPGGDIKFALGGEYRRETAFSAFDELTAFGGTFLNAIQPFTPPAVDVKEGYLEVEIPIIKDVPFFQELRLDGAVRVSDYNTSAGTVWSYNGAVYWAPVKDLRFRASYARSVRAPTQTDLYSTPSQNFGFVADPCDVLNINNGTSSRAANCAALGVPVGFVNTVARTQTVSFLSGGNPGLVPEKSDSFTVGGIFEPKFLPGFSVTVDWYDIKVKNLIASVSIQTILNQCVDSPSINNAYCALLNPRLPTGDFPTSVGLSSVVNFAAQNTSGIDADFAYNRTLGNGDKIALRGIFSYVIDRTNFLDPINPTIPTIQLYNLGDPQIEGQFIAQYKTAGGFSLRYQLQYIGRQTIGAYQAQNSYNGNPPTNLDQFPQVWYKPLTYSNVRLGFEVGKKYEFYLGVDNLFDKFPEYGLAGTGAGSSIYSNLGRQFYAGFRATF